MQNVTSFVTFFLIYVVSLASGASSYPDLYWSMDGVEGVTLYPDIGNRSIWTSQMNVSGYETIVFKNFTSDKSSVIVDGICGNALLLDHFRLLVGIPFNQGCLFDLNLCDEGGISVAMWILVRTWTDGLFSYIFGSSLWYLNGPGVALYEDASQPHFKAVAILKDGTTYFAAFDRKLIENSWNHVTMTWSASNGIRLYVNGSEVSYTQGPSKEVNLSIHLIDQLRFGGNWSDIILDEIGVWYKELNSSEVYQNAKNGSKESTKAEITSTTTINVTDPSVHTTEIVTETYNNSDTSAATTKRITIAQTQNSSIYGPTSTQTTGVPAVAITETSLQTNSTTIMITTERPFWYAWTVETVIAVTCGVVIATTPLILCGIIFYCIASRRKTKKQKRNT